MSTSSREQSTSENQTPNVVLGAGGAITRALVPQLLRDGREVILVSRRGTGMPGTRAVAADATDARALSAAVPEESTVYLLVGLPYDSRVWRDQWPKIMETAIRVCEEKRALLLFFDNVYMYGRVDGPMTEETPHNPISRKGEVRARIAERLIDAYTSGRIKAVIARSADFYGPGAEKTGVPNLLVVERMLKGKKAQWLADADRPHSLTYTLDCGRSLPLLAEDERAHNQIWHLPTARPPITGRQFVELTAGELGAAPQLSVLKGWMVKIGGLFNRTIAELGEMLYQNQYDYQFDSGKFERHFGTAPTPYAQGIGETIASQRQR